MTILRKGLLLIAVPLACQLLFVGLLVQVINEAATAEQLALHSKQVLQQTEGLYSELLRLQAESRGYYITMNPDQGEAVIKAEAEARRRLATLLDMVADNPAQHTLLTETARRVDEMTKWHVLLRGHIRAGDQEQALNAVRDRGSQTHLSSVRETLDKFLVEESRLDAERTQILGESRETQRWAVGAGVMASAIVAVFAAWIYSRSVSSRLAVVTANAERLADGRPLAEHVGGRDEIATLDAVLHSSAVRLRDAEGAQSRLRTEIERRAGELVRTNETLRQQTQENEMFVYSVSHDLRSPLVNLQGFSKELGHACHQIEVLIADPRIPDEIREKMHETLRYDMADSLRFIQTAVSRSGAIIDSLLRLSRAGRIEYHWQTVDVEQIVERVINAMRGTIHERQADLTVHPLPKAFGDTTAIEQIFGNLIGNAVNYLAADRPGRVEVGVMREGEVDVPAVPGDDPTAARGRSLTTYYVRDNGLGIPAAYLHKVFVAFQRLHGDVAKGEGIGLALVRRMVERHSGRVWVESKEGVGTTFFVALPADEAPTDQLKTATTEQQAPIDEQPSSSASNRNVSEAAVLPS
jgi:signal transduction histidine kinase